MPIIWTPNGLLDVATDPSDLPEQAQGKVAVSGAMTRCTNLHLDRQGIASTRRGSEKLNATALHGSVNCLIEQSGDRIAFAADHIYLNETSIASGLTDAPWSAILYAPYNDETFNVYATNGTDKKRIEDGVVREWGITAPVFPPALSRIDYSGTHSWEKTQMALSAKTFRLLGISSNDYTVFYQHEADYLDIKTSYFAETYAYQVTGDHNLAASGADETWVPPSTNYEVVYTYARYVGDVLVVESNPSPVGEVNRESGIWVAWLASTDAQVTHVRLYRSLGDIGGAWYYDTKYPVTDLAGPMMSRDIDLGAVCCEVDHDRPPDGITQVFGPCYNGILFGLVGNKLYYSKPNQPEYWPALYYVEVGSPQLPLKAGTSFGGQVFVASQHEIFLVSGTGPLTFQTLNMGAQTGTVAPNVFLPVKGLGVFHLGIDGLYSYAPGQDTAMTNQLFKPVFDGMNIGSMPGLNRAMAANCWAMPFENKIYLGYPGIGSTYPDNLIVLDQGEGKRVAHYQYGMEIRSVCYDHFNKRFLAGDSEGWIWEIECLDATTDGAETISWQVQTKEFTQFEKYFPRWVRYDVDLTNGATAAGELILSDATKQTHTLIGSRVTQKRLVTGCTGSRLTVRLTGTGPVDIYGVEIA